MNQLESLERQLTEAVCKHSDTAKFAEQLEFWNVDEAGTAERLFHQLICLAEVMDKLDLDADEFKDGSEWVALWDLGINLLKLYKGH